MPKAKIKLTVDSCHLCDKNPVKEAACIKTILKKFSLTEDECSLKVDITKREKIYVEFSATVTGYSVSPLALAETMERMFFGLKIYKREVIYAGK